jgi:hypothetical protein
VSGFPGQHSASEFLRAQRRADREDATSERIMDQITPARTPDADDFCDALYLRARLTRAGDRKTADMLEAAAKRIRQLEQKVEDHDRK